MLIRRSKPRRDFPPFHPISPIGEQRRRRPKRLSSSTLGNLFFLLGRPPLLARRFSLLPPPLAVRIRPPRRERANRRLAKFDSISSFFSSPFFFSFFLLLDRHSRSASPNGGLSFFWSASPSTGSFIPCAVTRSSVTTPVLLFVTLPPPPRFPSPLF